MERTVEQPMKKNKTMQAAPGDSNSTTATGAGAEGGVVRDHDSLSEGQLESIVGGAYEFPWLILLR
jgi:hypothetical protein